MDQRLTKRKKLSVAVENVYPCGASPSNGHIPLEVEGTGAGNQTRIEDDERLFPKELDLRHLVVYDHLVLAKGNVKQSAWTKDMARLSSQPLH